jgi:hypothetical protein
MLVEACRAPLPQASCILEPRLLRRRARVHQLMCIDSYQAGLSGTDDGLQWCSGADMLPWHGGLPSQAVFNSAPCAGRRRCGGTCWRDT